MNIVNPKYSTDLASQIAAEMDKYERQNLKAKNHAHLWIVAKTIGAIIVGLATVIASLPQIIPFLSDLLEKI